MIFKYCLIMAAGRGERMLPLTRAIPKPMAPLLSSTLLKQGYEQIRPFIENICITVGHHGGMLAEYSIGIGINTVINTSSKGNAWWIFNTPLSLVDEPVLVLTSDNITAIEYSDLYNDFIKAHDSACMIVGVKPLPDVEGDFIAVENEETNLIYRVSRTEKSDSYASGIQVINPFRINQACRGDVFRKDDISFSEVWNKLISLRSVHKSRVTPLKWFSVDTLAQLDAAEKYL